MPDVRPLRSAQAALACVLAGAAFAQDGKPDGPDPLQLVAQAEALLKKKEVEDAILVLWQAQELLLALPANPVHEAAWLSARHLLAEHDAREARRRAVFAAVATQQVELATAYRLKKWLDVAATRLAVADRYDRDVGAKERQALAAARPKARAATADKPGPEPKPPSLLRRDNADFTSGNWRDIEGGIEVPDRAASGTAMTEWVTKTRHENHEVAVEFRPADPKKEHDGALTLGLTILPGTNRFSGVHIHCNYDPRAGQYCVQAIEVTDLKGRDLGVAWIPPPPSADGWRRLAVRVSDTHLKVLLDATSVLECQAPRPVAGQVGLMTGLKDVPSCGMQFRNLRVEPLPADQPSDEELRAAAEAAAQNAITRAVDEAKDLLAKKQPEAASLRLRDALDQVDGMPAGVLRTTLAQTITTMLAQADPLVPRRKKAAAAIAGELLALADEYGKSGLTRAALELTTAAAAFEPDAAAAALAAARDAVAKWNLAQAQARAIELQPPGDDGARLREWFAKGRNLDSNGPGFRCEGAVARGELGPGVAIDWLPHPLAKPVAKASVHVRLPGAGTSAGLYFDVVDMTHFGLVFLQRRTNGLRLHTYQKLANKWVPLLQRDLPMDAWRLDAWHQLTVAADATGLVARCGTAEIKIPRTMLGKVTGVVGLFAGNDTKELATIELRAFQPVQ